MHHCLEIQEILAEIFQYISSEPCSDRVRSPPATLAGLARTCTTFTDPATDVLWHTQPADLFNLINCLPSHAVEVIPQRTPMFHSGLKLAIKRDVIRPEDFSRVFYYSAKIKVMSNSRYKSYHPRRASLAPSVSLADDALDHIRKINSGKGPLVPNVRELEVLLNDFKGEASLPHLVIGSALKSMEVVYRDNEISPSKPVPQLVTLAEVLGAASSLPTTLKLDMENEYFERHILDSPPAIVELLPHLTNVTFLNINSLKLSDVGVNFLSTLPALEKLSINITGINFFQLPAIPPDVESVFPRLKFLAIATELLSSVSQFVTRWKPSRLERFVIERTYCYAAPHVWDLEGFFEVLGKNLKNGHLLKELALYNTSSLQWYEHLGEHTSIISADIFRCLCAKFHNLIELSISLDASYDIDDASLMEIARGWPALRHLCFEECTFGIETAGVTPAGLIAFVAACPQLEELTLRFKATIDFPTPEQTVPSPTLRCLNACTSPIDDADVVAAFLEKSFPSLQSLKCGWFYPHPHDGEPMQLYDDNPEEGTTEGFYNKTWENVWKKLF